MNNYDDYSLEEADELLAGFRRRRYSMQRARGSGESSPRDSAMKDDSGPSGVESSWSDRLAHRLLGVGSAPSSVRASVRKKKKKEERRRSYHEQLDSPVEETRRFSEEITIPDRLRKVSSSAPRTSIDFGQLGKDMKSFQGDVLRRVGEAEQEDALLADESHTLADGIQAEQPERVIIGDVISPEVQQKMQQSLSETRQLRNDYDQLKAECRQAVRQLRDLRLKVTLEPVQGN